MLRRERRREEPHHLFWPDFALHAAVVMLVVFMALALLALFIPPPHESVARPADASYIPRPEWYFLFLMQILQFFPGEWEVVGAIILPSIAMLILLFLPFYDRKPALKPQERPLAITLGGIVVAVMLSLTFRGIVSMPSSMTSPSAFAEVGEKVYRGQDCSNCHALNGVGSSFGPELAGVKERRTLSWIHKYLEDPLMVKPDSAMPGYLGTLTHEEIEGVSMYLMSLEKAASAAEVAPLPEKAAEVKEAAPVPEKPSLAPLLPVAPPKVPHALEGRSACLACHQTGIGGAPKVPIDHSGRVNEVCLSCHKSKD